ncbi:MAG: hypothetical protein ACW964_18240, partial [Candidatus Hodarchaeales archaeon]
MSETTSDFKYGMIKKVVQLGALFGYRLHIEGSEQLLNNMDLIRGGSIFAGNHESVIDAFLM